MNQRELERIWPRSGTTERAISMAYQYAMQWKKKKYIPTPRKSGEGSFAKYQIEQADLWLEEKEKEWNRKGRIVDGLLMPKEERYSPTHPRSIQHLFGLSRDEARELYHPVVLKNINL